MMPQQCPTTITAITITVTFHCHYRFLHHHYHHHHHRPLSLAPPPPPSVTTTTTHGYNDQATTAVHHLISPNDMSNTLFGFSIFLFHFFLFHFTNEFILDWRGRPATWHGHNTACPLSHQPKQCVQHVVWALVCFFFSLLFILFY